MGKQYGLIGYPLEHSFSQAYFTEKFAREMITDASYQNFPLENITQLTEFLSSHPAIRGFNVTIPYKEQIIPYLDKLDPEAEAIGAVNCISVGRNGSLTGYNTDAPAFRGELSKLIGNDRPSAIVLGSGGASKAVCFALHAMGIDYQTVSRTPSPKSLSYNDLTPTMIRSRRLVINTTPLGMFPDTLNCPRIPYHELTPEHYLFDLIYNPARTEFLKRGAEHGARIMNGYGMLAAQAELSWTIWISGT